MSDTRPALSEVERDAAARTRIVTELDRNLLVEAGAGSGKTQKLAERMAAGIATGAYELERMAAVTFTRKAAAELRGRFQLALESLLEGEAGFSRPDTEGGAGFAPQQTRGALSLPKGSRPDAQLRIRAALSNLERFFAGTIHSFCARLLRERPVEAGVSPGFTELDDVEERLVREQSWRDYRAQAKASGDPDLLELLDAGITAKQLDKAFETICLYEDVTFPVGAPSTPLGAGAPMPDGTKAWTALEQFWAELRSRLPRPVPSDSTCKTLERAGRFERQWRAYVRGERDAALLAELLRVWESRPAVTQKCWAENRADAKRIAKEAEQLHDDFRTATVQPYLTAWRQYLYRRCVALLTKARKAAQDERRRRNALSFNDLLIMTADVLRTNDDVRRALQQKYRWLLVDEFQDTDPVQAEIMFLLASQPDVAGLDVPAGPDVAPGLQAGGPADWRTVPLRPGALFVVGDPKQSIYRFRRADIDIYNEVRGRLGGADGSGIVKLTTNFRSVPGLCEWANDVFKDRFPAAPTPHAPMFAPLDAARAAGGHGPDIAVLDLPATIDAGDVPAEEASRIARYIRAEVDAKRRTFGDFLILTRKKKGLRPYADALEALEIPVEVTGAGAFNQSEEVREIALLLSALADPQDAVALVGVLRGPLFGASDRDLFAFRQAGGYFSIFAESARGERVRTRGLSAGVGPRAVKDERRSAGERGWGPASNEGRGQPTAPGERVELALEQLRRWFKWTRMLPAGAALERIFEDSGYLALAATSRGGVEAGDLLHAIDRVRAVVESGFTLAEAADALASWSGLDADGPEESTEVDSLPLEPGRPDVVRLMNLHKAKGLEADVVFLADPLGGFDPRVDVRIVREGPTALGYFQIVDGRGYGTRVLAEPAGWDAHEAAEQAYLNAELDRLLYVAATRAKDTLVVSRYLGSKGSKKPAWDVLSAKMANAAALKVPSAASPPVAQAVDLSAGTAAKATLAMTAAHDRAGQPSWSATSVTAEAKRLYVGRPELEVRQDIDALDAADPTRSIVPDTPSHRADAGTAWGTLVHGLLEHAMRHRSATRDDLRRLAMWLTVEEPRLRPVIDQALDTVESVAHAEFWHEARSSAERHGEVPFAVRDTAAGAPRVVTGAIDLVHRTSDGWRVIDYKTDVDLGDADVQRQYADQVRDYATAWGRVARAPVTTAVVPARRPGGA